MDIPANDDVDKATGLLLEVSSGKTPNAVNELLPLVYGKLRTMAAQQLRNERSDHTLQPTALVHEVYLRLIDQSRIDWQGRSHFIALAARTMRNILVDHARARARQKRGGDRRRTSVELRADNAAQDVDILALDEALDRLEAVSSVKREIVELRFFGGLTVEETAKALDISTGTVKRHWTSARAWLFREIHGDEDGA